MSDFNLPKVLIVSRGVWNDSEGTSSTLTNLFSDYDSDKIGYIYIETKNPNTNCCNKFFQISEYSLIKQIFNRKIKTGFVLGKGEKIELLNLNDIAIKEENAMSFVRKNRSIVFSFIREIIWMFNGWKSKELKQFIKDFNPDFIWIDGSPLICMNRLSNYILKIANKPNSIFLMDDVYTYKSCSKNILHLFYKSILRKYVKKNVKRSKTVFVASPKMKHEYDEIFDVNSIFITKGIDFSKITYKSDKIHKPIKLVYLGQIIYGRVYSLIAIIEALKKINRDEIKMQLYIYTNNHISKDLRSKLDIKDISFLKEAVPYNLVPKVIEESDVVVFVESFEEKFKNIARLSFSTKITDYLLSSKCIFAIGPDNIAPIEYLVDNDVAVVATKREDVYDKLNELFIDELIENYSKKAFDFAKINHDKTNVTNIILSEIENNFLKLKIDI